MNELPPCPECQSEFAYQDGDHAVCPECGHEWNPDVPSDDEPQGRIIRDSLGNVLNDGDTVLVTRDMKIKGTSNAIKVGTKVKNIRLIDGDHEIDCKIDGYGGMKLRARYVKKV